MGKHKSRKQRTTPNTHQEDEADAKATREAAQKGQSSDQQQRTESTSTQPEAEQLNKAPSSEEDQDFDSLYLRQVTTEFADDIEKLRKAPDFKEGAVDRLVEALKQGAANFTEEEKRMVMAHGQE